MLVEDPDLGEAFHAGGADVLEREHFEHRGPSHPRGDPEIKEREGHGGEREVLERVEGPRKVAGEQGVDHRHVGPLGERRGARERARGRDVECRGHEDGQQQPAQVGRYGPSTEIEDADEVVGPSTAAVRRDNAERDAHQDHQNERHEMTSSNVAGKYCAIRLVPAAVRLVDPPVARQQRLEVVEQLNVDRLVQSEKHNAVFVHAALRVGENPGQAGIRDRKVADDKGDDDFAPKSTSASWTIRLAMKTNRSLRLRPTGRSPPQSANRQVGSDRATVRKSVDY